MKKILSVFAVVLAVVGASQFTPAGGATTQTVNRDANTTEFKVLIPGFSDHTILDFKHCEPAIADTDPATPQDDKGCLSQKVSANTDALLIVIAKGPAANIVGTFDSSATNPALCPSGGVGYSISLSGLVAASEVTAIYDPTPNTPPNGDSTKLVLSPYPSTSRKSFSSTCV